MYVSEYLWYHESFRWSTSRYRSTRYYKLHYWMWCWCGPASVRVVCLIYEIKRKKNRSEKFAVFCGLLFYDSREILLKYCRYINTCTFIMYVFYICVHGVAITTPSKQKSAVRKFVASLVRWSGGIFFFAFRMHEYIGEWFPFHFRIK